MASLPLLPVLPDIAHRRASTLGSACRGAARRALLLLGTPEELTNALTPAGGDALRHWLAHVRTAGSRTPGPLSFTAVIGRQAASLHLAVLEGNATPFDALTQAGRLVQSASQLALDEVVLCGGNDHAREALWSAWVASRYPPPSLRTTPGPRRSVEPVAVLVGLGLAMLRQVQAVERGAALSRWLTALPGNHLTPALYRRRVAALAKRHGWTCTVQDERALKRAGAGAFLAVAQGNAAADACLLRVRYRPRGKAPLAQKRGSRALAPVALVGKGVCFDTGGVNLKPHRSMLDMHTDMAGSAVTLGTLQALTELNHGDPVDAWLALAENHLAANAYKPQDVVVAANGTSIQVIHTDAEGRMLLADALALASRTRPALLVDFATLTGACIGALTERYAGLFTNRLGERDALEAVGRLSGERVWCFPLDADFDTELESKVADVIQCPIDGKGDHIYAARFLQRFVGAGLPWIHLDLAPATRTSGLAHITTDITGFGVRYATALLQDRSLLRSLTATPNAKA